MRHWNRVLKLNGRWACVECRTDLRAPNGLRPPSYCEPCHQALLRWQEQSQRPVQRVMAVALARGVLPRADTYYCTDCGEPAAVYDHRDYTKPLDVDPVCKRCNRVRGHADVWMTPRPVLATPAQEASA